MAIGVTAVVTPTGAILGNVDTVRLNMFSTPTTTQEVPLGTVVDIIDPYWGPQKLIYLFGGPVAHKVGECAMWLTAYVATALPVSGTTAFLSWPVAFARNYMAIGTYGWFVIQGKCPTLALDNIAVGAKAYISDTAAGVLEATDNSGGNICRLKIVEASSKTVAYVCKTVTGSDMLEVVRSAGPALGWFPGLAIAGTGVGAAGTSTILSAPGAGTAPWASHDGRFIRAAAVSVGVPADEAGVTVTATYTDATDYWNVAYVSFPHLQPYHA